MDKIKEFLDKFSEAHNIKYSYRVDYDPIIMSNRLLVILQRGAIKVHSIYLFTKEGAIDLVHLEDRLETLYNELLKLEKEAING